MGLTRIRAEQISDIDYKQAVRVITLTDITLSGGAPAEVDGVSLITGDRILVAGQSNAAQNGLYQVQTVGAGSNGTWVRTSDANEDGEIQPGMVVMVTQGAVYADTPWKLTTNGTIEIGVTELTFVENYSLAFGNVFANGTAVIANTVSASITFIAGTNVTIIGNNTTKTVTFSATGGGSGTPGGANTQVQFNDDGLFGGTAGLTFDKTTNAFSTGSVTAAGNITAQLTGQNVLLEIDRTDGAACFVEAQSARSVFGSVGATPLVLAYNSLAVVSVGADGAITVNPDGADPFTLPTADGNANELLATDGAGNVDFTATPSVTSITLGAITKSGTNGVGNIGQSDNTFNTVFAKATSAQYADVAEKYLADHEYQPGTVVEIGGAAEITAVNCYLSTRIAGVVSTDPAVIMNAGVQGAHPTAVALLGRVPCRVAGYIRRGDLLCASAITGHATAMPADQYKPGAVIGKALENHDQPGTGIIEVMVGRL